MKKTQMLKKSLFMTAMFFLMCCIMLLPSTDVSAQVKLNTSNVTLSVGQSKTIKLSGTSKKAKWSSNKPAVATVSSKGKIKAVSKGTATITAKVGKKSYKCKVFVFQTSSSGDAKVDKKVKAIIQKEIRANMTDVEKVKAIHDYIVTHCEYDTPHAGGIDGVWHTAYGALINEKAVCSGYAEAFQLCMEALNIPSQIISGHIPEGPHAWNLVQIDNNWYHIDVTFDDPSTEIKSFIIYEYFLVNDKKMKNEGRQWRSEWLGDGYYIAEEHTNIPVCSSSPNKFISTIAPVSKTTKQAANNLYSSYKKGNKMVTLVVPQKTYKKNKNFINETLSLFSNKMHRTFSVTYSYYDYDSYKLIGIFLK